MGLIANLNSRWQKRHRAMLEDEKRNLGFPGPSSVLRHYNSFTSFFRVRTVWEYAACRPGERVLIIGDAGGKDYWYFAWQGVECDVMDIAEQALIPRVTIADISSPELPFEMGAFDVVVMCDVLEHVYDDVRALQNIHAMLRDSGRLVISGPYWHDVTEYHVRVHTPRIIVRMLKHNGFKVERMTARGLAVNMYRIFHPVFLLMHYLLYKARGRMSIVDFNNRMYEAIKDLQAFRLVPYVDHLLFGQRGGLNGYIINATKYGESKYDHVAFNRLCYTDAGVDQSALRDKKDCQ